MKRGLFVVLLVGCGVSVTACREQRSQRVAASYSSAAKRTEHAFPAPSPQKPTLGIDAVPAEEDYQAHAAATIDDTNLEKELSAVERELR